MTRRSDQSFLLSGHPPPSFCNQHAILMFFKVWLIIFWNDVRARRKQPMDGYFLWALTMNFRKARHEDGFNKFYIQLIAFLSPIYLDFYPCQWYYHGQEMGFLLSKVFGLEKGARFFFIFIISYRHSFPSWLCLTTTTTLKALYRSISPSSSKTGNANLV